MPPVDSSLMLADSLITPEIEKKAKDSIINLIFNTGNEDFINALREFHINVDSIIQTRNISSDYKLIVSIAPNPASTIAYINYDLVKDSKVEIHLINLIGQDVSQFIETYNRDQIVGSYKIAINAGQMTPGLYIVNIKINNNVFSKKISIL